jgi:Molybdopterin converting factor, large subunit
VGIEMRPLRAVDIIIDEIKSRVPIWKKEHYEDGETEWLKGAG